MKHQSISKRILSMALALAMVLSLIPGNLIPKASAASLIPSSVSKVVYVVGTGAAAAPSGATTYTTLEDAMQGLSSKPAESAVIVILGTVSSTVSYNLDGAESHTGTYYITGKYGSYSGGTIKFNKGTATNYNFGGPVVIENITLNQSQNKNLNFHASTSLTIGDGVTMAGYEKFYIMAGSYHANVANSTIKVSSGKWYALRAGNNTKNITGTATITVDGSAVISSNIAMAGNDTTTCSVANAVINVNGGNVNAIYMNAQGANMSIGNVTVNLNGGESLKGLQLNTGTVTGNVTVNMSKNFTPGSSFKMTIPTLATGKTSTLNLRDFNGQLDSKIAFDSFDNVVVEAGAVVYTGNDLTDQKLTASSGASLCMPNVASQPSGVTVSGEVHFNTSTVPTPPPATTEAPVPPTTEAPVPPTTEAPVPPTTEEPVPPTTEPNPPATVTNTVYVSGSGAGNDTTGDGSDGKPFATLEKAYSYLAQNFPNESVNVILSGDLILSSDLDLSTYGLNGQVNLSSVNGARLIVSGGTSTNVSVYFGKNTNVSSFSIDASGSKAMFLFTGTEMVLGEGITTTGAVKVFCANKTGTANDNIKVTVNSGTYDTIFMGGNTGSTNGDVTLTFNGGTVTGFIYTGPNAGTSASKMSTGKKMTLTMSDGTVNGIINVPNGSGTVTDIIVNLNGGSLGEMRNVNTTNAPAATSFTANVAAGFAIPAKFGVWTGATVTNAPVLNLIGYTGNVTAGSLANYKTITFKNSSNATYAGTLASGQTVTVENGSTLTLSAYTGVGTLPGGVTVNASVGGTTTTTGGAVLYSVVEDADPITIYVKDAGNDSANGLTPETAVKTMAKAFELIAANSKNAGGTIVVCGVLNISANADLRAYGITGKVTITSVYGNVDYTGTIVGEGEEEEPEETTRPIEGDDGEPIEPTTPVVEDKAVIKFTAGIYVYFGSNTELNNLVMDGSAGTVYMYSGKNFAVGENVSSTGKLKLFCADYNGSGSTGDAINVTINSGYFDSVYAGGDIRSNTVGNVAITVGGTANIRALFFGGNKGHVGTINFTMNGGNVGKVMHTPTSSSGKTGAITVNLIGGTMGAWAPIDVSSDSATYNYYIPSVTINIYGTFADSLSNSFGNWSDCWTNSNKTAHTAIYLNIVGSADVLYANTLPSGTKIKVVESGSVLTLSAYASPTDAGNAGITVDSAGAGTVKFIGGVTSEIVYINGVSGSDAKDGSSPENAVKTLDRAYGLLNKTNGGTIVFVGNVTISADKTLYDKTFTGTVVMTSKDPRSGTNYGAKLIFNGTKAHFTFGVNTRLENIEVVGDAQVYLHMGKNMYVDQTVTTSGSGTLTLYVGFAGEDAKNVTLEMYGGTWKQILLGGYKGDITGNVTCTLGGTVNISGSVTPGSGRANGGNITLNMLGGYVKVLYDTPRSSGSVAGTITFNLYGGSIRKMVDYTSIAAATTIHDVVVNMKTGFSIASTEFGEWIDQYLTAGKRYINYFNYSGVSIPNVDRFQAVNLFGGDTVPSGFTQPAVSNSDRIMNVYDCKGILGVDLSSFHKLFVVTTTHTQQTDYPDVICTGKVPTTLTLSVDNTDFYILPMQNAGVSKSDYKNITLDDNVLFADIAYSKPDIIVDIDFENGIKDNSGKNNTISIFGELATAGKIDSHTYKNYPNITVHAGNEDYINSLIDCGIVENYGYNGKTALYIANAYGQKAKNYFTIDLSGSGLDVRTDNYTVSFWYMSQLGGGDQWSRSIHSTEAGKNNQIYNYTMGGTILSNQNVYEPDTSANHTGMSMYQMSHYKFIGGSAVSASGRHMDTDGNWQGNDDRWHYMTLTVDRNGSYCIYVDGELVNTSSISAFAGEVWGENKLAFGADVLGQYGLNNAYIDDIAVYKGTMNVVDIQANYFQQRISYLATIIQEKLAELGKEYNAYKAGMKETLSSVLAACENLTAADYVELSAQYETLRKAYEQFLAAPESSANNVILLMADIHFGQANTEANMKLVTSQLVSLGIDIDVLLSAGDFADKPSDSTVNGAYSTYMGMMTSQYGLNDALFINCFGNHDVYYSGADANYLTAAPLYKENMQKIFNKAAAKADQIEWMMDSSISKTDEGYKPYSFVATYNGIHYIALNTDYMKQTGNSGLVKDENGAYSIEGNKVDPIRHTMYICDNTFTWLKGWLDKWEAEGDNAPIMVACHYMFKDTIPLSFDSDIIINSNTVGRNDAQLRELLSAYKNVFYFTGHNHSTFGVIDPYHVEVTTNTYGYLEDGETGSFWEFNLPSIKANARGYRSFPHTWIMYVYDEEVVLRARDFSTQEWRTEFDEVIKLDTGEHNPVKTDAQDATCTTDGNNEYYYCAHCDTYYSDEACTVEIEENSWVLKAHGLTAVAAKDATCTQPGNLAYWHCATCDKYYKDADASAAYEANEWIVPALLKLGDANGDGYVDAYDAALILKYSVGIITEDQLNLAALDVDGDTYVDAYDATLIQKYSVGSITKFPVQG